RESNLHSENEKCRNQGPHRVDGVHDVIAGEHGISSERPEAKQSGVDEHDAGKQQGQAHQLSADYQHPIAPPFTIVQPSAKAAQFFRKRQFLHRSSGSPSKVSFKKNPWRSPQGRPWTAVSKNVRSNKKKPSDPPKDRGLLRQNGATSS